MSMMFPGVLVSALTLFLGAIPTLASDANVWVTNDGEKIAIADSCNDPTVIASNADEAFDVSDLADGESRTFGEGAHRVTATRKGDVVTIEHPSAEDGATTAIVCRVGQDTCRVLQPEGDSGHTMILVHKALTCDGTDEDCANTSAKVIVGGEGPGLVVRKVIQCNDRGNCDDAGDASTIQTEMVYSIDADGSEAGQSMVFVRADGGAQVVTVEDGGKVRLRCPKGDTTMLVDQKNADRVYLCPEHNVPLEKTGPVPGCMTFSVETDTGDEEPD